MTDALALRGVSVERSGRSVLADIDLSVAEGEVLALLGPSGSGKTTLLELVLGLLAPTRGEVRIHGNPASDAGRILVPPENRRLSVVFQDLALWPHMTVRGNLRFVLRSLGHAKDEAEDDRIDRMLARVGLDGLGDRYPTSLSGGEQQRVAIARALVVDPTAVLLDEPLANLDLHLVSEILDLLHALFEERGTCAIFVTHDPSQAVRLADRLAVVEAGRLVHTGPIDELPSADAASPFLAALRTALEARGG